MHGATKILTAAFSLFQCKPEENQSVIPWHEVSVCSPVLRAKSTSDYTFNTKAIKKHYSTNFIVLIVSTQSCTCLPRVHDLSVKLFRIKLVGTASKSATYNSFKYSMLMFTKKTSLATGKVGLNSSRK